MCNFRSHPFDFKDDATWLHFCNVVVYSAFTFTHPYFGRFGGEGLVWEYTNPHLAFAFHITSECDTSCLNLAAGKAAKL